jgi:RHS repeat-associated protein
VKGGAVVRTLIQSIGRAALLLGFGLAALPLRAGTISEVQYFHLDGLGNVRAMSNAAGALVPGETRSYLPYGEEWCGGAPCAPPTGAGQPKRFTGKDRDLETGLDYFGARYYGSGLARFTTVDPVLRVARNLIRPQRWNRYAYGENNPLKFVDPDGLDTYVVIYGAPYTNYRAAGQSHDVGGNFKLAAETRRRDIEKRPGFDPRKDAVVVVEARSTQKALEAVNTRYATGKIKEVSVFSHGYSGGISLGGEMNNDLQRDTYDLRELNYTTIVGIDPDNETFDAKWDLNGCNNGNGIAPVLANYLGESRSVSGFTGPAEFATRTDGGRIMVPSNPVRGAKQEFP